MLAHVSRRLNINDGARNLFVFKTLLQCSTATAAVSSAKPQKNHVLEEFLINSIGFSREEANSSSSLKKVTRLKPMKKDFSLIVNFFQDLGFSKTQIKSLLLVYPHLLFNDLDKTLRPKIRFLQDLGLSGSDLVKVLMGNKTLLGRGLDSHIKPQLEFLRNLFGNDDKVVLALKRCSYLLGYYAPRKMAGIILLLQKLGFSNDHITKLIIQNPRGALGLNPDKIELVFDKVENYLGIPRGTPMFVHGFRVMSSIKQSTIDMKWGVLRSFGWSDADIHNLMRNLPYTLKVSEAKMRKSLDLFMNDLGYSPAYLASRPKIFSLSLEDRIKPRVEVMKILSEKKLKKRNASLYSVVSYKESRFIKVYLLRYKDEIPDVYESYITRHLKKKIGNF
ncbi:uncharacterized protein [Coffea arabica]|uniref:Uncharacterized protein isoform X1 n=1 Tax=Coffea arabica TaxID=13443 RepID=A0ABM4VUX5_COFAR